MVYINSLQKDIFPNYLPPYQDELFSSWICRLSHNHGIKSRTFLKNYVPFGAVNLWNRDVDLLTPEYIKKVILDHTPLSSKQIEDLFISKHKGKVFMHVSANTMNVLSIGINHRQRKRFGQQCCILCLREESAYYKVQWRLATSVICTKHKCLLIDRCQYCESPISFFRFEFGGNQSVVDVHPERLFSCYYCHSKIGDFVPEYVDDKRLLYQHRVNNIISTGVYNKESSILYLNALLLLSKRLVSDTKDNRFRQAILESYKNEFPLINKDMRFWNVQQRYNIYAYINDLLHEKYTDLSFIFKTYKVTRSSITNGSHEVSEVLNNLFLR